MQGELGGWDGAAAVGDGRPAHACVLRDTAFRGAAGGLARGGEDGLAPRRRVLFEGPLRPLTKSNPGAGATGYGTESAAGACNRRGWAWGLEMVSPWAGGVGWLSGMSNESRG